MTIKEAIDLCRKSILATRARTTGHAYTYGLNAFAEYLQSEGIDLDDSLKQLNMDHFILFPSFLAEYGYAKQTMGVYVSAIKYLLDKLVIDNVLSPNYQETLRFNKSVEQVFKRRETRLPRFPQRGEAEKIKQAVQDIAIQSPEKERDIALVLFLYSSGCRNAEAASLLVKDIDLVEKTAKVIGKGNKERRVFFSQEAAMAFSSYWSRRGYSNKLDPVFARHDKGVGKKHCSITTTTVRNIIDQVVMIAGIDKGTFTPHYFRHAFAIKMLSETHDLALVQDLLGHASPAATRVYAKIYPEDLRDAHHKVYK